MQRQNAAQNPQPSGPSPDAVRQAIARIESGRATKDPRLGEDSTARFLKKRDGSGYIRDDGQGRQTHIDPKMWRLGYRGINPDTGKEEWVGKARSKRT
jgi:hypothetical protein